MRRLLLYSAFTALLAGMMIISVFPQTTANTISRIVLATRVLAMLPQSPLKIGDDYTMAAPVSAPTGVIASGGSCPNGTTFRTFTSWINGGGTSALSPVSADLQLTASFKKLTLTRTDVAPPSKATGWLLWISSSADSYATVHLLSSSGIASATLDGGFIALGTTAVAALACQVTGLTYTAALGLGCIAPGVPMPCCTATGTGTCTAGQRDFASLNKIGQGILGAATFAGGNANLITQDAHQLDMSGAQLKYDGVAIQTPVRTITVCASGCNYTSLGAACAANTSTAALPILFSAGPSLYSGKVSCGGQDHAVFWGAGIGASILTYAENGTPLDGTFEPSTSTNWTFSGFTVQGKIAVNAALTGGGRIYIQDSEFIAPYSLGSHDGIIIDQIAAGSRVFIKNNTFDLTYNADGIAVGQNAANADWYLSNNTIISRDPRGSQIAIRLNSIPCSFTSEHDIINMDGGASAAQALELNGYVFENDYSGAGDCAGTARLFVTGTQSYINNRSSGLGGSGANFLQVKSTASAIDELHIEGIQAVTTTTDNVNVVARGVGIGTTGAGTVVTITGSSLRTSGGASLYDVNGSGSPITIWSTYCKNEGGTNITGQHCGPLIDAPATVNVGDSYMDTSPADCVGTATGVWTKRAGTGGCT